MDKLTNMKKEQRELNKNLKNCIDAIIKSTQMITPYQVHRKLLQFIISLKRHIIPYVQLILHLTI